MRNTALWMRGVLALVAAILVGGPALLLADPPTGAYPAPVRLVVNGPVRLSDSTTQTYTTSVTFTNPDQVVNGDPEATYTAVRTGGTAPAGLGATISDTAAGGVLTVDDLPAGTTAVIRITGSYPFNGQAVTGTRFVIVTGQ